MTLYTLILRFSTKQCTQMLIIRYKRNSWIPPVTLSVSQTSVSVISSLTTPHQVTLASFVKQFQEMVFRNIFFLFMVLLSVDEGSY